MLDSVKIARRQSEIRQALAGLVGKSDASEDEIRNMETLDAEYRSNETRYRAALIAEDTERRDAGADLETRSTREWSDLVANFEMRQVLGAINEGRALNGQTAEIVNELRNAGGFKGVPVPWAALEIRTGETVAAGTPNPISTRPIIDRLFPASMASRMGAEMISIDSGAVEWPVTTSAVAAGWQATETGAVGGPTAYATTDKPLKPDHTLGIQMKITRRALLQTGAALEAAIRRDMAGAIGSEMDKAVFLGSGASGQPLGVLTTPATYGITATAVNDLADSAVFRTAVAAFLAANAAGSPNEVRAMIRPEMWAFLDGELISGTAVSEWDRIIRMMPDVFTTSNGLAAPAGATLASSALLTTSTGGVAPIFVGAWGAIDMIRDPYSDAASGGLRITGLATMDVTVARPAQLRILTGLETAVDPG